MSVSQLTAGFHVSQPAISQHLAVLKSAGLVAERREGRNVHYRSNPVALGPLADWVEHYRVFWEQRLDRMAEYIQELQEKKETR